MKIKTVISSVLILSILLSCFSVQVFAQTEVITENTLIRDIKANEAVLKSGLYLDNYAEDKSIKDIFVEAVIEDTVKGLNIYVDNYYKNIELKHSPYTQEEINTDPTKANVDLYFFPCDKPNAPFAVICPGGAYMNVAVLEEGFSVAAALNEQGYNAFVLRYRIGDEAINNAPVDDLAASVKYITENASEFNVDKNNYAVFGFSAGGHLAAEFGTDNMGYMNYGLSKPTVIVTGYALVSVENMPVIYKILLGDKAKEEDGYEICPEKHISADTPPMFIWAGKNDILDYSVNSALLAKSLYETNIPVRFEVYDNAQHGVATGKGTDAEGWVERACDFWEDSSSATDPTEEIENAFSPILLYKIVLAFFKILRFITSGFLY